MCKHPGCTNEKLHGRGLCNNHYGQWLLKTNPEYHKRRLEFNRNAYYQNRTINRKQQSLYRLNLKKECLEHYSNPVECKCCKEKNIYFLTIDHINGGGNKHRKSLGRNDIYRWLKLNNYPYGYQVLCMNCNWGRRITGVCPHES